MRLRAATVLVANGEDRAWLDGKLAGRAIGWYTHVAFHR